jgi:calmodulin-binding transcription activator
LFVL